MNKEEFAAFWRSSQELIRALVFQGRPPGTGAKLDGFSGRDGSGNPIELRRDGDAFLLHSPSEQTETARITAEELLPLLGDGSIRLEAIIVVPEIAEAVFPHAVREAEAALRHYSEAIEHAAGMGGDREGAVPDPFAFVMWGSALDRTIPSSISAIVLAVAAVEAQVNAWMGMFQVKEPKDAESDAKASRPPRIIPKVRALAATKGTDVDPDEAPWSNLRALVRRRNDLVHSRPLEQQVPILQSGREQLPGYGWTLEARHACWTVRAALVPLADVLEVERPRYLAYCPPGDPADDETWHAASILTGARDDPDFPRAGSRSGT